MINVSETYRNKIETIQETKLLAALNDCTSNYQELLQSSEENCFKVLERTASKFWICWTLNDYVL